MLRRLAAVDSTSWQTVGLTNFVIGPGRRVAWIRNRPSLDDGVAWIEELLESSTKHRSQKLRRQVKCAKFPMGLLFSDAEQLKYPTKIVRDA